VRATKSGSVVAASEIPGEVGKVLAAMGCIFAGCRISLEFPGQGGAEAIDKALYNSGHMNYLAGRTVFGLLPEPESSPGPFITSICINGAILAMLLYI
jgi:hypothetical protein